MHFTKFEIFNFKGIKHAVVDLEPRGAGIFTLIGLNESGKTTILEAIDSFDLSTKSITSLYSPAAGEEDNETGTDPTPFVPKRYKANFTDKIRIIATLSLSEAERSSIIAAVERDTKCKIDSSTFPLSFTITRGYRFEDSDYKEFIHRWHLAPLVKTKGSRHFRSLDSDQMSAVWNKLSLQLKIRIPDIIYFPTFLFNQPDKVILHSHEGETSQNAIYREIFSNVAQSLSKPLNVKKHIVDRILTPETLAEKLVNIALLSPDKQEQIDAAKSEISDHLTETVFERWSRTFGGDFTDREIRINLNVDTTTPGSPLVYAQFVIKDKSSTYHLNEMSLGFRWFFTFILFTLYRVSSRTFGSTLFLLDEPASNLHSRAQMQLLDSFPKIASGENAIIYSTHSHYLINPDWLDQAFIVSNAAIDYEDVTDREKMGGRRYTDIAVSPYRTFVGQNPDKVTYFQPVLDKLDVIPSHIDLVRPSVLVEGKGDYRVVEYVRRVKLGVEGSFSVVPTRGATGMDELIGLFLGWAIPFIICLDDDGPGRKARDRYVDEWGLSRDQVWTLADVAPSLAGKKIEGLLEPKDIERVSKHFGIATRPSKKQVQLFFGEKLAQRSPVPTSSQLVTRIRKLQERAQEYFALQQGAVGKGVRRKGPLKKTRTRKK